MRIVSLLPSATEIVCRLGAQDALVGRSHECDFPAGVEQLPVCTAPKFVADGTSYQLDERVKAIVQEGLSVYRVHGEVLRAARPDVIVTQAQCEVCAVSLPEVQAVVCEYLGAAGAPPPAIVAMNPVSLDAVFDDIRAVAAAIGRVDAGVQLLDEMRGRMAAIARRAASLPRVSVASVEWLDPLMTGGNWMPELIEMAGGRCLLATAGAHSPYTDWQAFCAADPDVIVILPCGFGIERTLQEIELLTARPGWSSLRAVRNGRVVVTDGNQYFNRPGPRLVESVEILAEVLHPAGFAFGHEHTGWRRLPA